MELSLASYSFGLHCAVIVDRYLLPGGEKDTKVLDPHKDPAVRKMSGEEQEREEEDKEEQKSEGVGARMLDQVGVMI